MRRKFLMMARCAGAMLVLCALTAQAAPLPQALPLPPASLAGDPVAFTVLAEPQLALPLTEISRLYSLQRRVSLLAAFEDSRTLFDKLLEGESGDVFITSMPSIITELRQRGMTDVYSQSTVASDALVMATRKGDTVKNRRELLASLQHSPLLLANPDRYVEGLYGEETLRYLFYDTPNPLPPRRFHSRGALYSALRSGDGVAILLRSEASQMEMIDLTVPIADTSYPPILYQGLAIAGENMALARDFLAFLKTSEAQAIFERHGFSPR